MRIATIRRSCPRRSFPSIRVERVKRAKTVQHVLAAVLLGNAAIGLQSPHNHTWVLPALELTASAALIVAAIREKPRHARGIGHDPVAWLDDQLRRRGIAESTAP